IAVNVLSSRQSSDRHRQVVALRSDPARTSASRSRRPCAVDVHVLRALLFHRDDIANLYLERRNVHFPPVHEDMSVIDDLPCLPARGRKSRAINDVVEATLKHEQKVLAGNPFLTQCLLEIISELLLEDEIDALYFLLFAELLAISGQHLAAGGTMLSRRISAALFDRA